MDCQELCCKELNCDGTVIKTAFVPLQTGCGHQARSSAYPCSVCGALYWRNGEKVYNRAGNRAFLIEGKVIHKKEEALLN